MVMEKAQVLDDKELRDAALQRLKLHILHNSITHSEILDGLNLVYQPGKSGEYIAMARKLFLSALFRDATAFTSGPLAEQLANGLALYPELRADHYMGTLYMREVFDIIGRLAQGIDSIST